MSMQKISAIVVLVLLVSLPTFNFTQARPVSQPFTPGSPLVSMSGVFTISVESWYSDYRPAVAYNSIHHEYMAVWDSNTGTGFDVWAARISQDGRVLDRFPVAAFYNNDESPSIAYDRINDRYLVVWLYDAGGGTDWDIYGRFIPWNGPSPSFTEFPICTWASSQDSPKVVFAYSQQEYLVVWANIDNTEPTPIPTYISARRVFAAGGSPDNDGWTVSSSSTNFLNNPDVTYNLHRNEYLVVWDVGPGPGYWNGVDIKGVRLRGDGIPLGDGEFTIAGWPAVENSPSAAACDQADQYLVGWHSDQDTGYSDYAIYARYLNGDAVPGNVYEVADEPEIDSYVDISCGLLGERYYLAWQDMGVYPDDYPSIDIRTAYPNETFGPISEEVDNTYHIGCIRPSVTGGKTGYLVVWEDVGPGSMHHEVRGRLAGHFLWLPVVRRP